MAVDNALSLTHEDFMRAMESQEDQDKTSETNIEDTQVTNTGSTNLDTNQENDDSNEETKGSEQEDDKEQSQEVEPNNTEVKKPNVFKRFWNWLTNKK